MRRELNRGGNYCAGHAGLVLGQRARILLRGSPGLACGQAAKLGRQASRCSKVGERKDRCAVRTSAVLFFLIIIAAPFSGAAIAKTHAVRVAPADEYFGRLKMSILGIRNELHDLALRLQYSPASGEAVLGTAALVENAMHDWEHKYPADPWLARSVYDLTTLYSHVHSARGHVRAAHALRWLLSRYGRTRYGALARTQIQISSRNTLTRK